MSSNYSQPLPPHLDPRGRHRGTGGGRSLTVGLGRAGLTLATLISISTLVLAGYLWYQARGIDNAGKRLQVAVGAAPSGSKTGDIDGKDQNILLTGNDDRTNMTNAEVKELHVGRDGGSMATDTMMIVHVPADGSKATLISLPRDSYVAIPGFGMGKLNSAYVDGYYQDKSSATTTDERETAAINLLLKTVTNLTGLTINHYIQVNLLGFVRISNAIGGVPIDLCASTDDTAAHNAAEGQSGGSGFKMSKGKHVISGITALQFVRQRHNFPNDAEDLDRVKRQQYFLTSAFRQVASVGVVTKLGDIKAALQNSIVTDSGLHLFQLAGQMANLSANNIVGRTIPTSNATLDDGTSILKVDPAAVQAYIDRLIKPPVSTSSSAAPTSATVKVTPNPSASKTAQNKTTTAIDAKCVN